MATLASNNVTSQVPEFISAMHRREASLSIGASTARGLEKGTVKAARNYLQDLDIRSFVTESKESFQQRLNGATDELSDKLSCKSWGFARKFLNIFLRNVLYNRYLCEYYGFSILEPCLEVPLDSHVATGLRCRANKEEGGLSLPRWKTIIGLESKVSSKYQDVANCVAKKRGIARVHLDVWYYRRERTKRLRRERIV